MPSLGVALLGAGISVVGSVISNLGVNVQKYSLMREEERVNTLWEKRVRLASDGEGRDTSADIDTIDTTIATGYGNDTVANGMNGAQTNGYTEPEDRVLSRKASLRTSKPRERDYYKQPLWLLGISFVIFGAVCDFSALAFAAQSIVATVGAITLVSNVLFAHLWLGEPLYARDMSGTLLVVCGAALAIAFGNHTDDSYSMTQIEHFYIHPAFLVYAIVVGGLAVICYGLVRVAQVVRDAMMDAKVKFTEALHMQDKELQKTCEADVIRLEEQYRPYARLHPFCYCFLAGAMGGQSLIFAKSVAQLIRTTAEGDDQFVYPLSYVFIVGMIVCVLTETHFLALGLKYFDALYIVPVFQCFFITLGAIAGGVFFGEFTQLSALHAILFAVGVLITLLGVLLLSSRDMDQKDYEKLQVEAERMGIPSPLNANLDSSVPRDRSLPPPSPYLPTQSPFFTFTSPPLGSRSLSSDGTPSTASREVHRPQRGLSSVPEAGERTASEEEKTDGYVKAEGPVVLISPLQHAEAGHGSSDTEDPFIGHGRAHSAGFSSDSHPHALRLPSPANAAVGRSRALSDSREPDVLLEDAQHALRHKLVERRLSSAQSRLFTPAGMILSQFLNRVVDADFVEQRDSADVHFVEAAEEYKGISAGRRSSAPHALITVGSAPPAYRSLADGARRPLLAQDGDDSSSKDNYGGTSRRASDGAVGGGVGILKRLLHGDLSVLRHTPHDNPSRSAAHRSDNSGSDRESGVEVSVSVSVSTTPSANAEVVSDTFTNKEPT